MLIALLVPLGLAILLFGLILVRAALHPTVGRISVGDILQEWVHHDRNHIKQALAAVQAYVWPAMGNTQKFSRA